MAKQSQSASTGRQSSTNQVFEFVNYDLTESDKTLLRKANPSAEQVLGGIASLAKEGYKVSISWDSRSDCVQAFLIGAAKACPNYGFILTARAAGAHKALASLFWKHSSVFDGVWHDRVDLSSHDDSY